MEYERTRDFLNDERISFGPSVLGPSSAQVRFEGYEHRRDPRAPGFRVFEPNSYSAGTTPYQQLRDQRSPYSGPTRDLVNYPGPRNPQEAYEVCLNTRKRTSTQGPYASLDRNPRERGCHEPRETQKCRTLFGPPAVRM